MPNQHVYFDEAGFTGNNLTDPAQPVFVCTAVAIDPDRAEQLVREVRSRFRIQALELKSINLLRRNNGHNAISWLLSQVAGHCRIIFADKEFALAGKFYEYVFEPILSTRSTLFYTLNFHQFIATLLYIHTRSADRHIIDALSSFARMMRDSNPAEIDVIVEEFSCFDSNDPIGKISSFVHAHRETLKNEVQNTRRTGMMTDWQLELSLTALHWLLATWGEIFEGMVVYCDQSKPLQTSREFFNVFIDRKDKAYVPFGILSAPSFVYNLDQSINLVDSKCSAGVQIADVVSGSFAYALKNPNKDRSREWMGYFADEQIAGIVPDLAHIDLNQEIPYVNSIVLCELADRSKNKQNLFENLDEFVHAVKSLYPEYAKSLDACKS